MSRFCCLLVVALSTANAAGIDGVITIKRKLTKRKVTIDADDYQRGTAVTARGDAYSDLASERAHVAVYIEGTSIAPAAAITERVMKQQHRAFSPDLLVVPAGSTVSFPNLDPIFHNVFSLSKPKSFDLGNYPANQTRKVVFHKPGIVTVNCHLHPNMSAAIVVTPNAWAVLAGGDGKFAFPGVPPGRYTLVAWHKAAGFFRQEVEVPPNGTAQAGFFIPLDAPAVPETASRR